MSQHVTYDTLTIGATAVGLPSTLTNPAGVGQQNLFRARLETAQVRYRYDGTDPTASEGMLLEIGETLTIDDNADARRIRFIRTGGTSGVLKIHGER